MRHILYILASFSLLTGEAKLWDLHSAYPMPKGRWEVGIFQPMRYGLNEGLEYSTHPLLFFVMPNISLKISQKDIRGYKTATRLKVFYPTPMLNMVARKGIGGLIDPNIVMPPLLGASGSFLASKTIFGFSTTFSAGVDLGVNMGELDERSSIDLPLVYHRLGVFYNQWGLHAGVDLQIELVKNFKLHTDLDMRLLPGISQSNESQFYTIFSGENVLEHKLLFIWQRSNNFRFMTGYKFVTGQYPYGRDTRLLPYIPMLESWVPIIELQWAK